MWDKMHIINDKRQVFLSDRVAYKAILFNAEKFIVSECRLVIYTNILSNHNHNHVCQPTNMVDLIKHNLLKFKPVRYYNNIVYRDNFSNIAIQYFLLAIAITATEIIMC